MAFDLQVKVARHQGNWSSEQDQVQPSRPWHLFGTLEVGPWAGFVVCQRTFISPGLEGVQLEAFGEYLFFLSPHQALVDGHGTAGTIVPFCPRPPTCSATLDRATADTVCLSSGGSGNKSDS